MENLITEGEIKNIKDNNFAINNVWYNNKFKKLNGLKKGDKVIVEYIVKNNKNYWQSVEIIKDIPEKQVKKLVTQLEEMSPVIPNQTENTILMCVKDLIVEDIKQGNKFSIKEMEDQIKGLTKSFLEAYKLL